MPVEFEPDIVIRYSDRAVRRDIMRSLGRMRPDMLRQIAVQSSVTTDFSNLVDYLLRRYCSRFVAHMERWMNNVPPGRPRDILGMMIWYHQYWESWRSSEPWADCEGETIDYFMNENYRRRLREADAMF